MNDTEKIHEPKFSLADVQYSCGERMYDRAKKLCETGKVQSFEDCVFSYTATVLGTEPYSVVVSDKKIDQGDCNCYMGERDEMCKHMLAVALTALERSGKLDKEETKPSKDLAEVKKQVSLGMRKLTAYTGPSRLWFVYQGKLSVGAGIIVHAVSGLEANKENVEYLWKLVLRISKKLARTGIDDSDGTVGGCVYELVEKIADLVKKNPSLHEYVKKFYKDDTGFGFENNLQNLLET